MKVLRLAAILMACSLAASAQDVSTNEGPVKVTRQVQPKALIFEVEVPASLDQVWQAMTTSEGLMTWLTPKAKADLRKGGDWLAIWPGKPAGGGTIIGFKRNRKLVIRAMAPDQFPTVRRERTLAVFEFEKIDAKNTRVRLTQTGWKQGKEWDNAYDYLAKGNAYLFIALRDRFIKGPEKWDTPGN
jgi:uncharacterized protein YndB with AHSA1/START domain